MNRFLHIFGFKRQIMRIFVVVAVGGGTSILALGYTPRWSIFAPGVSCDVKMSSTKLHFDRFSSVVTPIVRRGGGILSPDYPPLSNKAPISYQHLSLILIIATFSLKLQIMTKIFCKGTIEKLRCVSFPSLKNRLFSI